MTHYRPHRPEEPKKERGCFFYGCLSASIFVLILVIGFGYLTYTLKGQYDKFKANLSDTPIVLARDYLNSEDTQVLMQNLDQFKTKQETGQSGTLILDSSQINNLIQGFIQEDGSPVFPIAVRLDSGYAFVEFSIPINQKFLNGSAKVDVALGKKQRFQIKSISLNNQPLKGVLQEILYNTRLEDLINFSSESGDLKKMLDSIEQLEIQDDRLVIVAKPG